MIRGYFNHLLRIINTFAACRVADINPTPPIFIKLIVKEIGTSNSYLFFKILLCCVEPFARCFNHNTNVLNSVFCIVSTQKSRNLTKTSGLFQKTSFLSLILFFLYLKTKSLDKFKGSLCHLDVVLLFRIRKVTIWNQIRVL